MFNKIIKKRSDLHDEIIVAEPEKPLRIIPNYAVVIRSVPAHKEKKDAIAFDEFPENGVRHTAQADLQETAVTGTREDAPEFFDQAYINNLLAEKTRELEEFYSNEKEQAYNNGYDQGKIDGFEEGKKSLEPVETLLENMNKEVITSREHLLKNAEEIMGKLSLEIAKAVIGEAAMKLSGELLEYNLKRCLEVLSGSGKVTIKINPSDYEMAKEVVDMVFQRNKDKFNFKFEPDSSITPGGCFIESPGGAVDGRIENQFNLIRENFLQMI